MARGGVSATRLGHVHDHVHRTSTLRAEGVSLAGERSCGPMKAPTALLGDGNGFG